MPKFWVEIVDNKTTKYLLDAPSAEAAKEIAEDLPIEDVRRLSQKADVIHSHWEVSDVKEADNA